ncbi:pentapeptide repeat-containing protein [Tahibacter harae]|uniref:Pentapeptide repeat-containing protein n=1 Tax=Tahibacter harae TaxID=2963937 RepID=A0ABT1QYW7_9GAMM|nr:pentapeptide repeat-containing protein [Tahibacter harae]MCQ4167483.1 pentapeptide repeat-containing protein [Tahibacter harae]
MDGLRSHGDWAASSEAMGSKLELVGIIFDGALFGSDISFDSIVLSECTFNRCLFASSDFYAAFMASGKFYYCEFSGAIFRKASINNCVFENCRFDAVDFSKADLSDSVFVNCLISRCFFLRAFMSGARFVGCTIEGADTFADSDTDTAEFSGVHFVT